MEWTATGVETQRGDTREAHILVRGTAAESVRAPVMLNVLLDRSGSMKGAPLAAAAEAVQQLVEVSQPDDFMGLVVFDGLAEQRVPLTVMDSAGKQRLTEALQGISCGHGTALHAAVEMGLKGLQHTWVPGRQPRLLLLTDGEPSVGPESLEVFRTLGKRLAHERVSVHALGLSKHYVGDILDALTQPSGNAYEHVDGPDGLHEAMGASLVHLFGQAAAQARLNVRPRGLVSLSSPQAYSVSQDAHSLTVEVGDISKGFVRRVLLKGVAADEQWSVQLEASATVSDVVVRQPAALVKVAADSAEGKYIVGFGHELDMATEETAAWFSLARKDMERAEQQLEAAEAHLRSMVSLAPEGLAVRRHLERLGDLRLAVERGEGDIPLLMRRAQSARSGTHISQVVPLEAYRQRR